VTGLDAAPSAIAHARTKASQQCLRVEFAVADARELSAYQGRFDTIIDSGLFHIFSNADQARYLAALHRVSRNGARLHMLAISETAPGEGLAGSPKPRCVRRSQTAGSSTTSNGAPWPAHCPVRHSAPTSRRGLRRLTVDD
jgi:ubiquinone/menaquinone biosynthesis C-methylase UbiE